MNNSLLLLIGISIVTITPHANAAESMSSAKYQDNSQTQILQRFELPGTVYKHGGLGLTTFPPNAKKSIHMHSGPEVAYVQKGEISVKFVGQAAKVYKTGDSYQIPPNVLHSTVAGPQGAAVLATWVMK